MNRSAAMAPTMTNYSEIQRDEIEALRSIYMEDFMEEEAKTGAWNKSLDRAFKIKIRPAIDDDDERSLTLAVSFPPTYPKSLPRLSLDFGPDIAKNSKKVAQDILKTKPKSLLGSEMIYEIASSLQDTIDNTGVKKTDVPTLDEERTAREEAARLSSQKAEQERRQQELKAQEEEEKSLQELVKQRITRHETRETKSNNPFSNVKIEGNFPGVLTFDRASCPVKLPNEGTPSTINAVHKRVRYRAGPVCETFTVQPFQENGGITGAFHVDFEGEDPLEESPFLLLKECRILPLGGDEAATKRSIQNLESKLDFHTGLKPHQSVLKPLNFKIQRATSNEVCDVSGGWNVMILLELAGRHSLRDALDITDRLDIKQVRSWSIRLIEGLQHYHRHGAAHGSLHLSNILLVQGETEKGGRKTTMIKLSDGGFQRDLHLLKSGTSSQISPIAWTAPEAVNDRSQAEIIPATDIWNFGLCFLQMSFGLSVFNEYQSLTAFFEELTLTKSLRAMLGQVFNSDPKKRPSAWDLLHFEFFRNDDALIEAVSPIEDSMIEGSVPKLIDFQRLHQRRDSHSGASSRYNKDFVEEGRLGRGGFAEVFRARNKVDGQLYAIKKIKASSKSALDPVLSEATVLSRLNHPNVVRYFASWIDDSLGQIDDAQDFSEDADSSSLAYTGNIPRNLLPMSSRGLDFISSTGVNIVFGNEDEGDESETSDDDDADEISHSNDDNDSYDPRTKSRKNSEHHPRNSEPMTSTILYIQMEYCKQETLRDLINSGLPANALEAWRLFRQIVQGLVHIHGLFIVHRDLKPENIFIDNEGDVRIGDFGLARPGDYHHITSSKPAKEIFTSFTKDIGTASYVAPEVLSAGDGKYNEKADMYALGIILLEMNVAFSTGMERAETLEKVRKEEITLPSALMVPEKATQASIISSLVQKRPSNRPSSLELLESGQIPVQDENESLRMARRLLADENSHFRSQFINSLFSQSQATTDQRHNTATNAPNPMSAITLLEEVQAMSRSLPNDLDLQAIVKQKLTTIFQIHGAVERTDSPILFPYNAVYLSEEVVKFLHPKGKVIQLPYDLILPNAMLLAGNSRPEQKTFIFDNVYRVDPSGNQPKIFGEANFDIVSGNSLNLAVREAEVLKILDEILDTFPNLSTVQMCYHINHSFILDSILKFCDIESSKWPAVKETISKLHTGDWTWSRVRYELRDPAISIAATSLDELERFDFRDVWDKAVPKLRSILKDTVHLESTFAHLQAMILYLNRFGVKRKVYLSPLSSYNEKFYRGNVLFQCLYDQKRRSVLAAGGRYDQMIRRHQPITQRKNRVHAVGFQLAWTGLCADMKHYLKKGAKSKAKKRPQTQLNLEWKRKRCDVLVDSFDQALLNSVGIDILNELWANNISAELAETTIEDAADNAYTKTEERTENHNWVILIKSEDLIKVRSTDRKDETEVRTSDLSTHLRSEIRERDRLEGRAAKPSTLRHQNSQQEATTLEKGVDIKILTSENKGKKVNRKTVVEEALHSRNLYLSTLHHHSPIIAIETTSDIFDAISDTRLSDTDSWKKFIQTAPPGERKYLGQLQMVLRELADEQTAGAGNMGGGGGGGGGGGRSGMAIVYNFRTKACLAYSLRGG